MTLAMQYALKKRGAKGEACAEHGMPGCQMCHGGKMAEGGFVHDETASGFMPPPAPDADQGEEGIIDRIVKRFSHGGQVANDTPIVADREPNEFDELVKDDNEETSYVDDGSGDKRLDDDNDDIVKKVSRSFSKKDRMPRPA